MAQNRIAQRRQHLKLSQEDLAHLIGTNQKQVSRYETGKNDPTGEVWLKLAHVLDTSVDYLMGNTDSLTGLSAEELQLVEEFRSKTPKQQQKFLQLLGLLDVVG